MLVHGWIRIELSIQEANRNLELGFASWLAEDVMEALLRVKEEFYDLGTPISEDQEQQLIILSVPQTFESILFLNSLHLDSLFVKHHQLALVLIFNHFLYFGFFDVIFKPFVVEDDILLQFCHIIFDSDQDCLHGSTILIQNLFAFSLQSRLLLFTISHIWLNFYKL